MERRRKGAKGRDGYMSRRPDRPSSARSADDADRQSGTGTGPSNTFKGDRSKGIVRSVLKHLRLDVTRLVRSLKLVPLIYWAFPINYKV